MQRSITCYPIPGKRKALLLCEAFAEGARAAGVDAAVCDVPPAQIGEGAPVFYGVRPAVAHLWEQTKRAKREWYFIDNAYFDRARERFFRITCRAMQCDGITAAWSDRGAARFNALGLDVADWQPHGSHIVVCPQSHEFTKICGGYEGNWLADAVAVLKQHTGRELRVRMKNDPRPLADALAGAWALVTHMSCAAVEALLAGVPVFCTGRCSAQMMGLADLTAIEKPYYPERRREWAELLAANQWTLDEIRTGIAWRDLNPPRPH